jgi:hypothetical protein
VQAAAGKAVQVHLPLIQYQAQQIQAAVVVELVTQ